jgi:peroxiredoxin
MGCFQDVIDEFEAANTQVLGVSVDPGPSQGVFARELGAGFPLLSDWPDYETMKAYDTWSDRRKVSRRVTYVIDKQGVIRGVIHDERDFDIHAREALEIAKGLEA